MFLPLQWHTFSGFIRGGAVGRRYLLAVVKPSGGPLESIRQFLPVLFSFHPIITNKRIISVSGKRWDEPATLTNLTIPFSWVNVSLFNSVVPLLKLPIPDCFGKIDKIWSGHKKLAY